MISTPLEKYMTSSFGTTSVKTSFGILGCLVVFFLLPARAQAPATPPPQPKPLTGTFLQIFDTAVPWYWTRDTAGTRPRPAVLHINYTDLVKKFRDELKMNTIVIQNVKYSTSATDNNGRLIPKEFESVFGDPLRDILKEAKAGTRPVKVYMGLEYNKPLFAALGGSASVAQGLFDQTERDSRLVDAIVAYTDHPEDPARNLKFDGWYITTEIGNFDWSGDPERKGQFAQYIHDVAEKCFNKKELPIAISPYFNHANINADDAAKMVRDVLAGSRVTTVMVQDGVGAFGNSRNDVLTYFRALKQHLPSSIEIVADVELFTSAENVAAPSRILEQLRWQRELGTKGILGYEAANYLTPMPATDAKEMNNTYRVSKGDASLRNALYTKMKQLASTTP